MTPRRFLRLITLALLVWVIGHASVRSQEEPSEQLKVDALKLGYQLNGNSMVRWGSIDLTTIINPTYPYVRPTPELIGPPAPLKKEDKK